MSSPFAEAGLNTRTKDPCIVVIFGATGDLTARKLMPAIYNLKREGQLPAHFACVGFARKEKSHDDFRKEMLEASAKYSRITPIDPKVWDSLQSELYYHISDFDQEDGYIQLQNFLQQLDQRHGTKGNRVFYLATQPRYFPIIIENLKKCALIYDESKADGAFSRVIIEKPFGYDLESAKQLQASLLLHMSENQLYRIDHYLGKETVQNILTFRFANGIFESLWNHRYIDHVQITMAEDIGVGSRGKMYEESGLMRDVIQNHLMQVLTLVTMEPPVNLKPKSVHDEKVKVLEAIRRIPKDQFDHFAVRGQYGPGFVSGEAVKGYRQEENVNPTSNIETFGAIKLFIDNWRWDGVPFYIRAGKRLPKRATEISIIFKTPPQVLFAMQGEANILTIRIQPNEGISFKMNCKVPGPSSPIEPVKMDFRYGSFFGMAPPDAYERLICDCILGDNTLFARDDEVFQSWEFLTPLLQYWSEKKCEGFPNYSAGSWGPTASDLLIERDGRSWRLL